LKANTCDLKRASIQPTGFLKHATLHDIARECEVSAMTVSRVLAGRQGVGERTREKVRAVALRLKYEPSALAINFARNRSGFIGVATHFGGLLGTYYFRDVMAGFQSALRDTRLDFAMFDTISELFENPEELARLYRQRKADGLLIVAPHKDDRYLKTLGELGVPFVVIGERVNDPAVPSIACDDAMGIGLLCTHLRDLGHSEIAYLAGPINLGSARRRQRAYIDFMRKGQLDVPKHFVQHAGYTMDAGKAAALRVMKNKRRPTAILAANDLAALGVIEGVRECGFRVPEDVSVAGFDDLLPATESSVRLTTIRQPVVEIGERGARILWEAIETGKLPTGHVEVPVSLVVRDTTRPPARA
jgi:DNA-binding LacI/PurR family transcriptional regulator